MKLLNQEIGTAVVSSLEQYPDNPNQGAMSALEASVNHLGYYGAIIAQKSTRRVLAGNHRWELLMEADPELEVAVVWLEVDDDQALAILLGDNHINRLGRDDEALLLKALQRIEADSALLGATGYAAADITALVNSVSPKRETLPDGEPAKKERDPGNPVIQYQIIFGTEDEQQVWYSFVRWLKRTVEGDTLSERLTRFLEEIVPSEDEE